MVGTYVIHLVLKKMLHVSNIYIDIDIFKKYIYIFFKKKCTGDINQNAKLAIDKI